MTLSSSLKGLMEVYFEAFRKKARGRFRRACSNRRNRGGKMVNKVGFMVALHTNIMMTPSMIRAVAMRMPISCKLNGTDEGYASCKA